MATEVVVVDNHDSFVHTIVGYLRRLGATVTVLPERDARPVAVEAFDGVLISPGPGSPRDATNSRRIIEHCAVRSLPMLGVCLGHQALAVVFGGAVGHAPSIVHGRTDELHHDDTGVFTGLPDPLRVTRYHSLTVDPERVPSDLRVSARTRDGVIMGLAHRTLPLEGVQFHPESVLSESGYALFANWLVVLGDQNAPARAAAIQSATALRR